MDASVHHHGKEYVLPSCRSGLADGQLIDHAGHAVGYRAASCSARVCWTLVDHGPGQRDSLTVAADVNTEPSSVSSSVIFD